MTFNALLTSTGSYRAKLDRLLKGLRAKTAKDRAAARKYALDLLSQPNGAFARFLSRGGPGTPSLWLNLVDHSLVMIEIEVEYNRRRPKQRIPTNDLSSFLLRVIRLADASGRPSLHSLVRTLLRHVIEHISGDENEQSRRVFGADYMQIVMHLFEIPQYCELVELYEFEEITRLVMSQIIESITTASTSRSDSIMWATTLASILCHYCGDMYSIILPIATFVEGLVKDVNFSQKGLGTGTMSLVLRGYLSVIQRLGTSCADILRIHGTEIIHAITRFFRDAPRKDREVMLAYLNTHLHIAWSSTRQLRLTQDNSDSILSALSMLREMCFAAEEIDAATLTSVGRVATSYRQLTDQGRLHLKLCKQIILISHEIEEGLLFSESKRRAASVKRTCRERPWEEVKHVALSLGRSPSDIRDRLIFLRVLRAVLAIDSEDWPRQQFLLTCHEISIVLSGLNDLLLLDLDQHSLAWVLDCLLHAAVLSSASSTSGNGELLSSVSSPPLEPIWTCIWHTLLRSDLPFVSLTSRSSGDIGVDEERITGGDFVMDILSGLLGLKLVARGAIEKSQDMSYRVLNIISGFFSSYSLHNGPDVIMEGGKEKASTRRGRLLQLVMNWLQSRLGSDQSILCPLHELPGSEMLFSSSSVLSNHLPTLHSYRPNPNSIPFPTFTWRALRFQEDGTLIIYHDFVLKYGLGWLQYVQRELAIEPCFGFTWTASKAATAQRGAIVSSELLLHEEIMADFQKALKRMEAKVQTTNGDSPQAMLLARATMAKAFCNIANKCSKLEQVAANAVNIFTSCFKSFYSAGHYEPLISALCVVRVLGAAKPIVNELQEFCENIVNQWVAGENMPVPAARNTLASTNHPGSNAMAEEFDDFMDITEEEIEIEYAGDSDNELKQQLVFTFISQCLYTTIGASWPISLNLIESIRSFVMESYEKDLVDDNLLIEIANSLALSCQHSYSAALLDAVADILEKALYRIRGKVGKVSYVWLLRWLTAFGRSIRGLPQFGSGCKEIVTSNPAEAGGEQTAKMLKPALCRLGEMLHVDLLGMEEVQAARMRVAIIRETILWCTMVIFTCCPAANQNWFTQEVLERCIKDEDDAVRLRSVGAVELLITRHSPSKHSMIYSELMQILAPLEREKSRRSSFHVGTSSSHSNDDQVVAAGSSHPNVEDSQSSSKQQHHRLPPSTRKDCELTTLQIMCCIASISKSVCRNVLFDLCEYSMKPDMRPLIPSLVGTIARRCSIPDAKTLLLSHIEYIVYHWLCESEEAYSLENFPYELFGFESMQSCLHCLGDVMVPLAFLSCRDTIVNQVTAMYPGGRNTKQILKNFWPIHLAFRVLLKSTAPEVYETATSFIQKHISPRSMGFKNGEEQLQCVLHIVALSVADPFGPFDDMDHNTVHSALDEVSRLSKSSPRNASGLLTNLNFLDIMLNARIHLLIDPLDRRTMMVVQLLVSLMDWTQNVSMKSLAGTIEVLLSVLEMQVKTKGTWPQPSAVTILGQLCEFVSQNETRNHFFSDQHLRPIVQALFSADADWTTTYSNNTCEQQSKVECRSPLFFESGREEIEFLLEKLLLDTEAFSGLVSPADVCTGVDVCRPRLNEWYTSTSTECCSPIQRLKIAVGQLTQKAFARRGALLNVCPSIDNVRDALSRVRMKTIHQQKENHDGIGEFNFTVNLHCVQWENKGHTVATEAEELTGILNTIAGTAVALCKSQDDDPSGDVRKSALQLLGDIGPLPEHGGTTANETLPFKMDFTTAANTTTTCKEEMELRRPLQWTEMLCIRNLKLKALELLCLYLLDPDEVTSVCALATMRTLCATMGKDVLNMINDKALYLTGMISPFIVSSSSKSEVTGRRNIVEGRGGFQFNLHDGEGGGEIVQDAFSDYVWSLKGRTYDQWVCSVAPALLTRCTPIGCGDGSAAATLELDDTVIIHGSDPFLSCFSSICKMKSELAECLFPAAVYELIAAGERMDHNPAELALSQTFTRYLIKPPGDRWLVKATRLGLIALNLLRQHQVSRFVQLTCGQSYQNVEASINVVAGGTVILDDERLAFEGAPYTNGYSSGGLPFDFYLDLNFKDVAMAAMRCGAWRSALLYAEFWFEHEQQIKEEGGGMVVASSNRQELPVGGPKLLTDILLGLGDTDNIQGFRSNHLSTTRVLSMASAYAHQGEWRWALPALDAFSGAWEGQLDDVTYQVLQTGIATALMQMGLPHVLETYLLGLRASSSYRPFKYALPDLNGSLGEFEQETRWRHCGQVDMLHHMSPQGIGTGGGSDPSISPDAAAWATVDDFSGLLKVTSSASKMSEGFHARLNEAVSALKMSNLNKLEDSIKRARDAAMQVITEELSIEGGKQLSYIMVELQTLVELEEASKSIVFNQSSSCCDLNLMELQNMWTGRLTCPALQERYQLLEPIAVLREVILRTMVMLGSRSSNDDSEGGGYSVTTKCATSILFNHLLTVANAASVSGHLSQASGAIIRARQLCTQDQLYNLDLCVFSEARVAWARGDSDGAIILAKSVVAHYNSPTSFPSTATALNSNDNTKECCQYGRAGLFVRSLITVGEWMAKTRSESSQDILDNYMRRAVAVSDCEKLPLTLRCSAHLTLARYVSGLHTRVRDRVRSAEWQLGNRVAESRQSQLLLAQKQVKVLRCQLQTRETTTYPGQYDAMKRHAIVLEREVRMDAEERRGVEDSVEVFLLEALHEYEIALRMSNGPDVHDVFRVMSLCFAAPQFTSEKPRIADAMINLTYSVPSYKFVSLAYQISSRIGSGGTDGTSRMVGGLVRRLCKDHPYHLLPKIFALANGNRIRSGSRDAEQYKRNVVVSEGRITAAIQIISELYSQGGGEAAATVKESNTTNITSTNIPLGDIIYSIESVFRAYLDLAMASTEKPTDHVKKKMIYISDILPKGGFSIVDCGSIPGVGRGGSRKKHSNVQCGRREANVSISAPVITRPPPVQPDGDYSQSILTVCSISPTIELTDTGIHTPKIVRCTASDGKTYRQLVKSGDDLRQDAVMQQVFIAVNGYLSESGELNSQHGDMRTYNIVPLSPDTGVIEWVNNTMPFGSYLVDRGGRKGAHSRYFPNDISCREARELMKKAMTFKAKLQAWKKVESRFHPAFRFFFMEHFPDPCTWYRRRQQYTRSVATASMVGYVLGIGDRHCQNILMDVGTGEVVHIDFGVTFEQGKALSTPETVPFRLTRDVVDGMGPFGTEGTFRHSCELTLQVLRDNATSLNTILEVFVHDPLFRWMLSPINARQRQCAEKDDVVNTFEAASHYGPPGGASGRTSPPPSTLTGASGGTTASRARADVNSAERALIRVRQKLQGYEDPNGEAVGVEGQVKLLINEAQSPENLSCLYPGWAPWV